MARGHVCESPEKVGRPAQGERRQVVWEAKGRRGWGGAALEALRPESRTRILARVNAFLINTGSLTEGEKGRDVSWGPKEVQGTAAPPFGE